MTGGSSVVVMAKAPRPGRVKTRLHPLLGPAGCARLQRELLAHTCATVASCGLRGFVFLDDQEAAGAAAVALPEDFSVRQQVMGDLGRRMSAAVQQVWQERRSPVLVIGTDAPTLTAALLAAASRALANTTDVVLGPALDGGYYLIGLPRPLPKVFAIDPTVWGGDQVLSATQQRLRELGAGWQLLPALSDLDTPQDALRLRRDPMLPKAIGAFLDPSQVPG